VTWLAVLQTVGIVLSGVAAAFGAWNRWHIRQLRTEVNGQTHALVEVTHALGVSEGTVIERDRADHAAQEQSQ
jgi:hypothetical protein